MNNIRNLAKRAVAAVTTGSPREQVQSIRAKRIELIEERKQVEGSRRPLEEAEAGLGRLLDNIVADLDVDLSAPCRTIAPAVCLSF